MNKLSAHVPRPLLRLPLPLLLLACTLTASATTVPILTLTEKSDTVLEYSWSTGESGVVKNLSHDLWSGDIGGPSPSFATSLVEGFWIEPTGGAGLKNYAVVAWSFFDGYSLTVLSDSYPNSVSPVYSDGSVTPDGTAYRVRFIDQGDSAPIHTPDAASTLPMAAGAFLAVAAARRKFVTVVS